MINENTQNFTIPSNWVLSKIGSHVYKQKQQKPTLPFTYIDIASIDNKKKEIINPKIINPDEAPSRARRLIKEGAIVYSTVRPYLENLAIIPLLENPVASTGFCVLDTKESLYNKYLFYYLQSDYFYKRIVKKQTGASYPAVKDSDILNELIPIPPLNEQRRIIKKLEYSFKKIEEALSKLYAAEQNLTLRMKSILDKKINLSGGKLFNLDEIGTFIGGGTPSKKKESYWGGTIPWISSKDMKKDYIYESQDWITEEGLVNSSAKLVPMNSLLIVTRSGILKHSLPVAINKVEVTVNQDLKVLIPKDFVDIDYLLYVFKLNESKWLNETSKVGATVDSLDVDKLKKVVLPIPSMEEQKHIVKQIEYEIDIQQDILHAIKESEDKLEKLRKSLLQKAFRGDLVEQLEEEETGAQPIESIKNL